MFVLAFTIALYLFILKDGGLLNPVLVLQVICLQKHASWRGFGKKKQSVYFCFLLA